MNFLSSKLEFECEYFLTGNESIHILQLLNLFIVLRIYNLAETARGSAEAAEKESRRMTGVTWLGAKQGGVFAGTLPTSGATFLYQVEGQRLMACLPIMECFQLMQKYNVSDLLETLAPEDAPTVIKECLQVKSQTQTQTYCFFCSSLDFGCD